MTDNHIPNDSGSPNRLVGIAYPIFASNRRFAYTLSTCPTSCAIGLLEVTVSPPTIMSENVGTVSELQKTQLIPVVHLIFARKDVN